MALVSPDPERPLRIGSFPRQPAFSGIGLGMPTGFCRHSTSAIIENSDIRMEDRRMRPKTFDQTRALEAAMLQFWESGFEGSSMQNLVDRMGISRQSLYDTYGNKRDLFEAALKKYREEIIEPKLAELSDSSRSPTDLIRGHLESIAAGGDRMPVGCLLVRTATETPVDDTEIGRLLDDCVKSARQAIQKVIERGQVSGEFDAGRPAGDLAAIVIATGMGLHVMRRLPNQGRAIRPSIDSILAGLKASVTEH